MANLTDKLLGQSLMVFSSVLLFYYTIWVIILPLIESSHYVHQYFLSRHYALLIPMIIGVIVLVCVGVFVTCVLYVDSKEKTAKAKKSN